MSEAEDLRSWEHRVLAALATLLIGVFGVWAGVVWSATEKIVVRLDRMTDEVSKDRIEQQQYRLLTERRLTIVEVDQEYIKDVLVLKSKEAPP